jgi:hypothetical protein
MKINSFVFYSVYESFDRADKNILNRYTKPEYKSP